MTKAAVARRLRQEGLTPGDARVESVTPARELRFSWWPTGDEDAASEVCLGMAASGGAVLLAGGAAGKRFALANSRILIHQPHGGAAGQAADIEIQAKEIIRMRDLLNEMIAIDTGQSLDKVVSDTDRDFIMSAAEAKDYGIIDEVITTRELAGIPAAAGVA